MSGFALLQSTGLGNRTEATSSESDVAISSQTVVRLVAANAIVILVEIAVLFGHLFGLAISTNTVADEALTLIMTGSLAVPFWLGVVLFALLLPLTLYVVNWRRGIETVSAGRAITVSPVCVILGGLLLRAVITVGGQI